MEIVFLGTGGSFPSPQRGVSSIAVKTHGEVLLFDCGEGTQRQLMRSRISFMQVSKVFITHFHGDHYLGLPGLLQTMALNGRTADLEIYGPKGTEQLVTILERISYYSRTFDLVLHELKDGQIEHFPNFKVSAHRLDHSLPTLGYLLVEDERPGKFDVQAAQLLGIPEGPLYAKLQAGETILWEGEEVTPDRVIGPPRPGRRLFVAMDTKPIMELADLVRGIDVLIHEATADRSLEEKANKFGHSTASQAATIAKEAKVRRMFMVHISPRYRDIAPLIDEARAIFPESYIPSDLESFEVPFPEELEEGEVKEPEVGEPTPEDEAVVVGEEPSPAAGEDVGALVAELEDVVGGEEAVERPAGVEAESPVSEFLGESPKDILSAPADELVGSEEEEEEFDLDRAMLEAGIDPNVEDDEVE